MSEPINVDEARVALKTWSLRIPNVHMALLNAALDRMEELEKTDLLLWKQSQQATQEERDEARAERDNLMAQLEKLQKLFCDKCVWEACGDCAGCQKERADSVEAECDVLKARMKELERERDCWKTACGRDSLKMFEVMGERDALRAQLETAKGLLTVLVAEWKDPRLESLVNAKTFLSSKEGGE